MIRAEVERCILFNAQKCVQALEWEAQAVARGEFEHAAAMAEAAESRAVSAFEWAACL